MHASLALAAALRRKFRSRARLFGAWMSIGHPEIAAMFAAAKGDFVGIDMEHTTIDLPTAQMIIRTCHEHGRACLPRPYAGNIESMRRLLDAGADGIIVPQVSSRAQIQHVIEELRYPPQGRRGFGVAAAHQYGRAFDSYVRAANRSLSFLIQIETMEGVEQLNEILTHPAVDGVMVGPYDLSGSLGVPGELSHPKVTAACRRVIEACASRAISCGIQLVHPRAEDLRRHVKAGFTFLVLGSDIFSLTQRSREVDAMIEACRS